MKFDQSSDYEALTIGNLRGMGGKNKIEEHAINNYHMSYYWNISIILNSIQTSFSFFLNKTVLNFGEKIFICLRRMRGIYKKLFK